MSRRVLGLTFGAAIGLCLAALFVTVPAGVHAARQMEISHVE